MSDETKTQEQRDAEEIERMRKRLDAFGAFAPEWYAPALRTIHRLKAKESALRDELSRAYRDLADMHEGEGYYNDAKRYRARADALELPAPDGEL